VRPNNLAGIFVVLVLIASISFILLPVGLELGVEITRNAETSTAVLWTGGNAVSFLWVIGQSRLLPPTHQGTHSRAILTRLLFRDQ